MKRLTTLLVFALLTTVMALGGCGYKQTVTMKDKTAYLRFTGSPAGCTVSIDNGPIFPLEQLHDANTAVHTQNERPLGESSTPKKAIREANVVYEVAPGKHHIRVMRGGDTIVDRVLLLGNQMTREIALP